MSIFALQGHQSDRPVFTNLPYTFPHTNLYFQELDLNNSSVISRIRGAVMTLDELSMILDSRSHASQENIRFSKWLFQVKKQGIDLYGTIHEMRLVDIRLRENHDWLIDVQSIPKNRPPGVPPTHMIIQIQNGPLQDPICVKRTLRLDPSLIGMYDTTRAFDPREPPPGWEKPVSNSKWKGL